MSITWTNCDKVKNRLVGTVNGKRGFFIGEIANFSPLVRKAMGSKSPNQFFLVGSLYGVNKELYATQEDAKKAAEKELKAFCAERGLAVAS